MKTIVIIGAGASGLMAAAESAKRGNRTVLIEKNSRPARKVMISGKGRCNLTNACYDMEELIAHVPTNPRFLYSAFSAWMPYDTIDLIESLGVPTKIERGNRVFPVSDKAVDVVDALVKYARQSGAELRQGTVKELQTEDNRVVAVTLESGEVIPCDAVAICTGGKSYPLTGSTGDGYRFAAALGHTIVPPKPALVPLAASNWFIPKLQGLSLKNVSLKVMQEGKEIYRDFGEMLFTHFGVSGPIVLSASSHIHQPQAHRYELVLDLKPALDDAALDKRLQRDFAENHNKDFINSLGKLLPHKLIPVIVKLSGIEPSEKCHSITKEKRLQLVQLLKHFTLEITGFRPVEEAIVTSGGVSVKEINPKTMQSKIIPNLYFAGEVIDVDAYTGGFNLQIAFSTGHLCGTSI